MNISEVSNIIEMAEIGICEKDEILNAIEDADATLKDLIQKRESLDSSLEAARFEMHQAKNDAVKQQEVENLYGPIDELHAELDEMGYQCQQYESMLQKLQQALAEYKNFNKKRFFENVRFLLKTKTDIKIGQIEKEAGVSLGYISRIEKEGNTSDPSIEFVFTVAKLFNTSLDVLLNCDLSSLNPTEKYLVEFLEKLKKDTIEDKLDWNRESAEQLNHMDGDINGNTSHPLFSMETYYEESETEYPEQVTRILFDSHTYGYHTCINEDCFNLNMKNNSVLYFMSISKSVHIVNDPTAFSKEIWMYTPGVGTQFLVSNRDISQISELVELLYDTISKEMKHPKVKKEVKSIIDAFMNGDLGENDMNSFTFDEDDEMPFK